MVELDHAGKSRFLEYNIKSLRYSHASTRLKDAVVSRVKGFTLKP